MNIRMKRGMALVLMASLLLAGSAQALFGLGKSKPETVSPENGPTARDLEIRTYRGIPYLGQLEAADPDGGELTFAIVTQPKKGTVTVEGANFTYTPKENAAGGDSFTYSAANSAGAVSLPATVTVTIEKTRSGVTYADTGEATATAAQDLAERGVFTGAKIGDKWYFEPDRTVSRGEFLAMVLETAGAEVTDVTMTGFRDDDAIPTWAKSYAAAGVAEGILRGKPTEDGAVFSCEEPISFSEAATVLNRVLDLGDVELEVWFADREAAPSWAAQAVGNMEALNVLSVGSFGSDGLETALAEQVKSERLKADLITNVSHDIKTPLTSIINYVDLIKREKPQDPTIQKYLEVLDQKSQRLKTLTEDLVEASRASSGNIKLDMANIDIVELVQQTNGEFEEKYAIRHLDIVTTLPNEVILIEADGRRLWRVLENLYNNAFKYAMEGTRVYVGIEDRDSEVVFSIKNVSATPLNISPDELTERFVRGDTSRTTEGSGLGLSIAKDLTQLQGGRFEITIDGDLFKAELTFAIKN